MTATPHLFNPKNESFDERIRSYKTVLESYKSMESSLDHLNQKDWSDRLGTPQEIEEAQLIISNSLKIANASINASDIRKAEAQGLLSSEDLKLIAQIERQLEIQQLRESKSQKQQQTQKHNFFKQ